MEELKILLKKATPFIRPRIKILIVMKKTLLLFSLAAFQITFVFSQRIKDKGCISISVGPALPAGKFSSKDLNDKLSGFTKMGESVSISYSKLLSKNWGIAIDVRGQRNPLNTTALQNSLSSSTIYQGIPVAGSGLNFPPPQFTQVVYPNWQFEKQAWLYGALLLGPTAQFTVDQSKKITLITNAMIGAVYAKSPVIKGSSITDTATARIEQSKSSAFGFIYSFSGGINYSLNKKIFLSAALTYAGTNQITFKDVTSSLFTTKGNFTSASFSAQQSTTTADGKQPISSINLLLGIGIKL
jgi:hypothetical protein